MPPLKRIIPAIHANWNSFKSGSDTTTAIMESHRFKHPHINSKKEQLAKSCLVANLPPLPPPNGRTSHRFGGPILQYTTPRTFETPTRNYKTDLNWKPDDSDYWTRVKACQQGKAGGLPFFAQFCEPGIELTRPYRCWLCGKDTFSMCFTCRQPLCNVGKVIKNQKFPEDTVRIKPFTNKDQRKEEAMWYGVMTCFFKEHSHHLRITNYQADEGVDEQDLSGSE